MRDQRLAGRGGGAAISGAGGGHSDGATSARPISDRAVGLRWQADPVIGSVVGRAPGDS